MKKKLKYRCVIFLSLLILLFPIKLQYKDGGSIEYRAILYRVIKVHRIDSQKEENYIEGIVVKVLGFEIYNNIE